MFAWCCGLGWLHRWDEAWLRGIWLIPSNARAKVAHVRFCLVYLQAGLTRQIRKLRFFLERTPM
jgi:hypothetical protein